MALALRIQWDRLSKLISGFLEARQFYLNGSDKGSFIRGRDQLAATSNAIVKGLDTFLKRYRMILPEEATQSLESFLDRVRGSMLPDPWNLYPMEDRFLALASIRSMLDFYLADFEWLARRLSERAFSHLKRSIVVDRDIQCKWQSAYAEGEIACERLGAVHLLMHGIWAFKAHSSGERTDLVMGDRLCDLTEVERSAEALVLTEWKKVTRDRALSALVGKALKQAARYASGSLSGIELSSQRYLVFVSEDVLDVPSDYTDGKITYRYINIPVNPLSPSHTKRAHQKGLGGRQTHNPGSRADGNRKQRGSRSLTA